MASRNKTTPPLEDGRLYKIGEVSRIVGVESFVLRYWQTEFPQISPAKSESRHRLYDRSAVETILRIKELLHVEKYTIEGARRRLELDAEGPDSKSAKSRQLKLEMPPPSAKEKKRRQELEALLGDLHTALGQIRESLKAEAPPEE